MAWRDRLDLLRGRGLTLGTLFELLARVHGDVPLVEEDGEDGLRLTYADADRLVSRWAGALRTKIDHGDRVVIAAPNGYGILLLCCAAARAGAVAVPVNPKMRDDEIEHVVDDSKAALVVRDCAELDTGEPIDASPADSSDVAALFYTSGTTGKPKGAQLTHRALVGQAGRGALYPSRLRRDEAVTGMPVAHIAGFSMLVQAGTLGVPVYLLRKFRPDDALDAIERRRATVFVGVPAMYRMMAEAGAERRDLSSVRVWASGADAMPFDLARKFQRLGASATLPVLRTSVGEALFVDGYGMVELGGGVAVKVLPPLLPLRGALAVPLPGYRLKVVDDAGRECTGETVGELVVKGPGVMRGYHDQQRASDDALTPDGWMRTGDLARRRYRAFFELAGRKKDLIKHGGYSVFAMEVESVLAEHPGVAEATVVGLPDERKGEVPVAAVIRRDGQTVTEAELLRWAGERLSDYKVPRRVLFVTELPRTGTDKVQKSEVKKRFMARGTV